MVEIDDVLNEITMIRRVHEDQVQVWEDLHERPGRDCKCDPDNLPHVQRLNSITQRLEEDALKVRESVSSSRELFLVSNTYSCFTFTKGDYIALTIARRGKHGECAEDDAAVEDTHHLHCRYGGIRVYSFRISKLPIAQFF